MVNPIKHITNPEQTRYDPCCQVTQLAQYFTYIISLNLNHCIIKNFKSMQFVNLHLFISSFRDCFSLFMLNILYQMDLVFSATEEKILLTDVKLMTNIKQ
jgi:hypothetical protein